MTRHPWIKTAISSALGLALIALLANECFTPDAFARPLQDQTAGEQAETEDDDAKDAEDGDPEPAKAREVDDKAPPVISIPEESSRDPEPGDRVRLVMEEGPPREGVFVRESAIEVTIEIANVQVRIERTAIRRISVIDPPLVRYHRLRSIIDENDYDRRAALADWASRQNLFDVAITELRAILEVEPRHPGALKLLPVVEKLRDLKARSGDGDNDDDRRPDNGREFSKRPGVDEFPLLNEDQINLLKVYEIDLDENPRLLIKRDTVEKLLAQYVDHPLIPTTREGRNAFFRKAPAEVLDIMFRVRARDLYREVTVLDQPTRMAFFRDRVHATWLVNSCATTRCHGGTNAGSFQLINRRPTADATVYTNFLIIERFRTSEDRPLIDYAEPHLSPLLHYGLPTDDAFTPHPQVRGWTPIFRSRDDRRFRQAEQWIGMMYRPRPEYPVEYEPPGEKRAAEEAENEEPPVER